MSFFWGDEYIALPADANPWILKDLITQGAYVNLYGKPKAKKSSAALGIAIAVSSGEEEWLGFEVCKHGPVMILQVDTPRNDWRARIIKARNAGHNVAQIAIADKLSAPYPFNILDEEHRAWFKRTLNIIKPVLVFVDTLREIHQNDENDSGQMKQVFDAFESVKMPGTDDRPDPTIVFISHARKEGQFHSEDVLSDNRGSSYIPGKCDTIIKMTEKQMFAKGRSISDETKRKWVYDEASALIFESAEASTIRVLSKRVIADGIKEGWSFERAAKELMARTEAAGMKATGLGTARDRLTKAGGRILIDIKKGVTLVGEIPTQEGENAIPGNLPMAA